MPDDTQNDNALNDTMLNDQKNDVTNSFDQNTTYASFETEPTTQPTVATESENVPYVAPTPEKKSKKGLIVGAILATLLVLGLGGSAAAYSFWYQAPGKVLADAATNLIQSKAVIYDGTLSYESKDGDSKLLLTFDGQADRANRGENVDMKLTMDEKTYPLKASFIQTEDVTFYFKFENLIGTVESYQEENDVLPPSAVELLEEIDGRWVEITLDDMKEWSQEYADTQKCVGEVFRNVKDDETKYKEIADAYVQHPFVTSKGDVKSKDGNLGFDLDIDEMAQKSFVGSLNDTALMKQLQVCDESYKLEPEDYEEQTSEAEEKSNIRVYVSKWTHELRQVVATFEDDEDKGELNLKPRFVESVDVVAPKDAMSIDELQDMIDDVSAELYGDIEAEETTTDASRV